MSFFFLCWSLLDKYQCKFFLLKNPMNQPDVTFCPHNKFINTNVATQFVYPVVTIWWTSCVFHYFQAVFTDVSAWGL